MFENIRPLFSNKPLMVVVNKIDTVPISAASAETKAAFAKLEAEGIEVVGMSTLSEEGVMEVKTKVHQPWHHLHRFDTVTPTAAATLA